MKRLRIDTLIIIPLFVFSGIIFSGCSGETTYEEALQRIEEKIDDPARREDARLLIDLKNHALAQQQLLDLGVNNGYSSVVVDLAKQSKERVAALVEDINDTGKKEDVRLPETMSKKYQSQLDSLKHTDRAAFDAQFVRELKIINSQLGQMLFVNATEARDADIRAFAARKVEDVRAFTFRLEDVEKNLLTTVQQ